MVNPTQIAGQGLRIGEAAAQSGVSAANIRYYEKEGLIEPQARGDNSYRLFNYQNDLWIECTFDQKMKVEDINRWNAEAKFSRLVFIEQKDKSMVSLEAQLDCLGGVSDAVIRQYINRFDEEAKRFAKFMK